jgi:hypothetical protein
MPSPWQTSKPAIAQLAEHLTVDTVQTSDRPWFDSGWPEGNSLLGRALSRCSELLGENLILYHNLGLWHKDKKLQTQKIGLARI